MKFIYNDLIQAKTISASSTVVGFEAINISDIRLSKKWRSTGTAIEWIKIDMGVAVNINSLAILSHNFTAAATVRIQAHATDAWGAPTVDVLLTYKSNIMYYRTFYSFGKPGLEPHLLDLVHQVFYLFLGCTRLKNYYHVLTPFNSCKL